MGNHITCCRQKWFRLSGDAANESLPADDDLGTKSCYLNSGAVFSSEHVFCHSSNFLGSVELGAGATETFPTSCNNRRATQHISEREPEDLEFDPSFNASRHALFITSANGTDGYCSSLSSVLSKSFSGGRTICASNYGSRHPPSFQVRLRRWSSCYTMYLGDCWFVYPQQGPVLQSVSIAIELLLDSELNRIVCESAAGSFDTRNCNSSSLNHVYLDVYDLFDERKFPLSSPSCARKPDWLQSLANQRPRAQDVHCFINNLFRTAFLGPQTAIVALIFLERLLNSAEVGLLSWTWRRQFLACVLLASKVLDDQAVWNTDYRRVLQDVSVEDLNALERHTLSLLQFNIEVPLSVYARYYFDVLAVGQARGVVSLKRRLLTSEAAKQLNILPTVQDSALRDYDAPYIRSLFGFTLSSEPVDVSSCNPIKESHPRSSRKVRTSANLKKSKVFNHNTRVRRPSSCHSKFTLKDPANNSLLAGTSLRLQSTDCDEGPLMLDEETEYVNGLVTPSVNSPSSNPLLKSKNNAPNRSNPSIDDYSSFFVQSSSSSCLLHKNLVKRNSNRNADTNNSQQSYAKTELNKFDCTGLVHPNHCSSDNVISTRPGHPNGLGFMRSVMGGDVAYTLLRDTGMY